MPDTPPCRPALSADLIARAVIAAAGVYGDSPVQALTPGKGSHRRCLSPAVSGICAASGRRPSEVLPLLAMRSDTHSKAFSRGGDQYERAAKAAERAARYAAWRPEARETVVGGAADDAVELPPPAVTVKLAPKDRPAPRIAPRPARPAPDLPEAEPRGKGSGLTDEDRVHLKAILKAHGSGFPAGRA